MSTVRIIEEFNIRIRKDSVFKLIDCYSDSPNYDEVAAVFEQLAESIYNYIEPKSLIKYVNTDEGAKNQLDRYGHEFFYVMNTIGKGSELESAKRFEKGEYLEGMLIDAMADDYLFQMEAELEDVLREECAKRGRGIKRRLEAPGDIPMELQKIIYDETDAAKNCGMKISSGYMLDPVKSCCFILALTKNKDLFNNQHNCRKCKAVDCKLRHIPPIEIAIIDNNEKQTIICKDNQNILEALKENSIYVPAYCGGRGTCGKCGIVLLEGELPITKDDEQTFDSEQLNQGYRLSCRAYPQEDCSIRILAGKEDDFEVLSDGGAVSNDGQIPKGESLGLAIDIGTTTIAIDLVALDTGVIYAGDSRINKQRAYGADVISRIQAANNGQGEALRQTIVTDIVEGIKAIVTDKDIAADMIKRVVISANTTMCHLLMGYNCGKLGVYPFNPYNIETIKASFGDIFLTDFLDAEVIILPGISTYVGGDIVSGLLACGFFETEEPVLLVDLGTNGEMAIGNKDCIICTSTAAGPAFEGGNISSGIGSVAGAICAVRIEKDGVSFETIGNQKPVGICGTGVLDITAELIDKNIVDETGLLEEAYFEKGYPIAKAEGGSDIVFTGRDIREIQLAKAAIRAGIDVLLKRYKATYDEIKTVFIAGGFGFHIDIEKAVNIGLIPEELKAKVEIAGNTSLKGAIKCLLEPGKIEIAKSLVNKAEEISLGNDADFNEFYMEAMFFEKGGSI